MMDEHFREFQKKNKFRTTDKEPTCYSCKGFDSVNGHDYICLASEKDYQYMKISITTVCNNFSPA